MATCSRDLEGSGARGGPQSPAAPPIERTCQYYCNYIRPRALYPLYAIPFRNLCVCVRCVYLSLLPLPPRRSPPVHRRTCCARVVKPRGKLFLGISGRANFHRSHSANTALCA
ncbi:unnamed protein product, partial [Iphiclides podalirius]